MRHLTEHIHITWPLIIREYLDRYQQYPIQIIAASKTRST